MTLSRFRRLRTVPIAAMAILMGTAVLNAIEPAPAGATQANNSVNMATQSGSPYYIFPINGVADDQDANTEFFQWLMWTPLYENGSGGSGASLGINDSESIANPPSFAVVDGKDVVTVTLKSYTWSDGTPVTTRDVQFWENLVSANEDSYGGFVPGEYPSNIESTKIVSPTTIQFNLNGIYNPTWFTNEELTQITPLPQQAWDKTCATCAVGNNDVNADGTTNVAGSQAVFKYLSTAGSQISSFTTDPLWKTIDGPWQLSSVQTNGPVTFVPNPKYTGPEKAKLSHFITTPYTSPAAEFNALQAGQVDYGIVPTEDIPTISTLKSSGFRIGQWYSELLNGILPNLNNAKVGVLFRQAYVRQALQLVMDQPGIIKAIDSGYAATACGPTPTKPDEGDLTSLAKHCPWAYNPNKAVSLLKAHGWKVVPNGASTCARPGAGASQCGKGIAKGAKLEFSMEFYQGYSGPIDVWKSDATLAGIVLNLKSAPIGTVYAATAPCTSNQAACNWQLNEAGWIFGASKYPSGGEIFSPKGAANKGSYVSAEAGRLITAVTTATSLAAEKTAYAQYENYIIQQVPMLLLPEVPFEIAAIRSSLKGVDLSEPYIEPQEWHY
jgi:peptide/nickel transport system substrate-binding protein